MHSLATSDTSGKKQEPLLLCTRQMTSMWIRGHLFPLRVTRAPSFFHLMDNQ
ncbi:hypothetical protein HMPREF0083_02360 [Aneurinibacillus aneurinilyticus ATCC 12856]|uniref:Uncharacterized protein n=1 Tax=Aneurinibacillus aneurinilyticus ATCC 12856 TaxID=649747 RepID=U1WLP9_ANEAE|nr:hypothetical protein HMPREF0083_02360 [Aneurinibacillus aneurinilyticus ATCC 12856]